MIFLLLVSLENNNKVLDILPERFLPSGSKVTLDNNFVG